MKDSFKRGNIWKIIVALCLLLLICIHPVDAAQKGNVSINAEKHTLVVGGSYRLKLSHAKQGQITWKSTKPKTVSVTGRGKITGLRKGTATIKATYKGKTYKCVVKVESPKLNRNDIWVMVGTSTTVSVSKTTLAVSWKSANPGIASVTNGVITANRIGKTKIYAVIGGKKLTCKVEVLSTQDTYARQMVTMINDLRSKHGVPALTENAYLRQGAAVRAKELSRYYSEKRPNKTSCYSAIPTGYKWSRASELTARYYTKPEKILQAWANNPDHLAILLNSNYKDIGVSVYVSSDGYFYWCLFEAVKQK